MMATTAQIPSALDHREAELLIVVVAMVKTGTHPRGHTAAVDSSTLSAAGLPLSLVNLIGLPKEAALS
jgi:hypothetical protein